ncbi:MAG: Gfo/Idh/MocA family oxidoreductase [Ignavibacteria bacterium]|nr:Gfo/Idh/MocA family oxidoreductase [Ignavibacteria bacterium]
MYNALVIGCGNIGAGYDFNNGQVLTHAKALSLNKNFSFKIFDIDKNLAAKVSERYNCGVVNEISEDILKDFDLVSICSPTKTHFEYLTKCLDAKIKVIICEKPVSSNENDLPVLLERYNLGDSKVQVNYTRRFQPAYSQLKAKINTILEEEKLTNLSIRYQRGFLNNCSHAVDLVEFLTDKKIELKNIQKSNFIYDHFENDPTLTLSANWNETNINILGLSNILFPYFDIDFYFESSKIEIKELGRTIEILKSENHFTTLISKEIIKDAMKDNMINVLAEAEELLKDSSRKDNFLDAVQLNQKMLNYLNN